LRDLIGNFEFKHPDNKDSVGYYTMAVRFPNWSQDPSKLIGRDSDKNKQHIENMIKTNKLILP